MAITQYSRTELVIGKKNQEILHHARVAVFGVGGVGGNCVEALARCGIGKLDLIDNDTVALSNINRQIIATHSTIGMAKVDAAEQRIHDIDPTIAVQKYQCFFLPENKDQFDFSQWDFVVDAIDTVTAKIAIIQEAQRCHVPVISSMGCGNKMDPSQLRICDLFETVNDPLARIMRHECRKRGIEYVPVIYSLETTIKPVYPKDEKPEQKGNRPAPGSTAFVPPVAGIMIASYVVRQLTHFDPDNR